MEAGLKLNGVGNLPPPAPRPPNLPPTQTPSTLTLSREFILLLTKELLYGCHKRISKGLSIKGVLFE